MDRVRSAITLPIIVFPAAAIVAIAVGMLLHLVKNVTEETGSQPLMEFGTPFVALLLVLIVTAAGFIAAGTGDDDRR